MPSPIAFVSKEPTDATELWLSMLGEAMPQERIVDFSALTLEEKEAVDFAIVANPEPEELKELPNLKWVHSLWAGVEKMVAELSDALFEIVRLEDPEMAITMAEAVLAWTLYLHRDMPAYAAQQRRKEWIEQPFKRAGGSHVGIVGFGNLGQEAARALLRERFTVSGWSRRAKEMDGVMSYHGEEGLSDMLAASDIVVCLIPVTPATRGIMNASQFAAMKKGAALINFARGPIIDNDALLHALDTDHLSHAVLDVFDEEPLPGTSPFWSHEKVTVLPHISGPTNRETATKIVATNVARYRETGTIPKSVDKKSGY